LDKINCAIEPQAQGLQPLGLRKSGWQIVERAIVIVSQLAQMSIERWRLGLVVDQHGVAVAPLLKVNVSLQGILPCI
jgi:hypothetical protein